MFPSILIQSENGPNTIVFPSILIQSENGPNEFFFLLLFFISSSDPNLLRKKSVKQKIKKRWPLPADPWPLVPEVPGSSKSLVSFWVMKIENVISEIML